MQQSLDILTPKALCGIAFPPLYIHKAHIHIYVIFHGRRVSSRKLRKVLGLQVWAIHPGPSKMLKITMLKTHLHFQLNSLDFSYLLHIFLDTLVALDKTDSLALINLL